VLKQREREREFLGIAEKEQPLTSGNHVFVLLVTSCDMEFGSALLCASFHALSHLSFFLFFCFIFGFWIDARA
jgi:hypothetical protein